jgi:hypothetical protein
MAIKSNTIGSDSFGHKGIQPEQWDAVLCKAHVNEMTPSRVADNPTLWHQAHQLDRLRPEEWDKLFLPGITSNEVENRQYMLQPVDGGARYERRGRNLVPTRETPHQDIDMTWPKFALCLSHMQVENVTLLLQELSRHQVCLILYQ